MGLATIGTGATSALGLSAILGNTTEDLELTSYEIPIQNLPPSFEGFRIGVLSDIHHGVWLRREYLELVFAAIQRQPIDVLVLAGDFLWVPDSISNPGSPIYRNHSFSHLPLSAIPRHIMGELADLLSGLGTALPILSVFGNHDRWVAPIHTLESLNRGTQWRVLVNQSHRLERAGDILEFVGVDDYWTGIPSLPRRDPSVAARILIAHNPDYVSEIHRNGLLNFELSICGHTHGGQVKIPCFGPLTYNLWDSRLGEGINYLGERAVFTSRGIGVVELPLRINCRPEYAILSLKVAKSRA